MKVASLNNISFNRYNYKPNFEGNYPKKDELISVMPFKARKLVKRMDQFLENKWAEIRKANSGFYDLPFFVLSGKNKKVATIKPVYQGHKKYILFEVSNDKNTERILINRQNPDLFRFERIVDTDYGYATTKTYNSEYQRNEELEELIGKYIEEFFPKILPRRKIITP